MAHALPHAEVDTLQSPLQLDPSQSSHHVQQSQAPPPAAQSPSRKRKKNELGDEVVSPSEPRRLRRSHEACARCRSKKIKCDSKHPRCTACATAGTPCNQEDRHRQTLTPRGHTDRIERQLAQCEALLKHHHQGFDLNNLEEILAREGLEVNPQSPSLSAAFQLVPSPTSRVPSTPPGGSPAKGYQYPQHMIQPGYNMAMPFGHSGASYPLPMQIQPSGAYNPHNYPAFQQPHSEPPPSPLRLRAAAAQVVKGQDPRSMDMSSQHALAKSFGVSAAIVNDLKLNTSFADREDLGVGSSELASGRDRNISETSKPRDPSQWISVSLQGNAVSNEQLSPSNATFKETSFLVVWLPKDRKTVKRIVDVYFTRLNIHRPVFVHKDFEATLDAFYDGQSVEDDAGYICSLYLILALGTLSHRASQNEGISSLSPTARSKLLLHGWPEHDEFFDRAMTVKPELRVTVSSLQALILLHWYLYTERPGRSLWRLVGSLVRFAIELGLHHDPTTQENTFTEEECRLRINLWAVIMVHDRGTSILLGRPLAIAPSDSNTPRPKRNHDSISEHFILSSAIAEIQADIINSLYAPTRQSGDAIMRHATRIIKSMVEFRRQLPEAYKVYIGGTEEWPMEKRIQLVQEIQEDPGLTLLKVGITRILLLRVLFSSKDLSYPQRHKALIDAIVTSHNIIVVHNQLIKFPDIALFVSPIPLHIAAMVILYGCMSNCDRLSPEVALEDVSMALDLLPRLRWRWERKDANGGHPLITKLAQKVLGVNLLTVPASAPVLLPEHDWDDPSILMSPASSNTLSSSQSTPTMTVPYAGNGASVYGAQPRNEHLSNGVASVPAPDKRLLDVPPGLFYPFYPENQNTIPSGRFEGMPSTTNNGDLGHLFATAAHPDSNYACPPSHESLPGRDPSHRSSGSWMGMMPGDQRGLQYPIPQT